MKPGATIRPRASITFLASLDAIRPILAMRPFLIPMSPRMRGARVPSMIIPSLMTMSNSGIRQISALVRVAYLSCFALIGTRRKKSSAYQASVWRVDKDRRGFVWRTPFALARVESVLVRAGLEFDADRHDNPHHRIVERDAHRELHNTAIVEKAAQRVESPIAHLDVGGRFRGVAHHGALVLVEDGRAL